MKKKKPLCPDLKISLKAAKLALAVQNAYEVIHELESSISTSQITLDEKYLRNFKDWEMMLRFMFVKIQTIYMRAEHGDLETHDIQFKMIKDKRGNNGTRF